MLLNDKPMTVSDMPSMHDFVPFISTNTILGTKMKCCLLAFFFFGIASGFSFVHPSGNQESFLAVLQNLFLGRQLKDFPNCGRPREITENKVDGSTDGLAAKRQVIDNEEVKECLGLEGDDSKTIIKSHDNVGSKDYENNKTKTGYIYSKRSFIKAKFYFLNIEPSFRCSYDYLQFRDAKSGRYWRYISTIFLACANFWPILGHFWAILAILGHFWANLGNFGSFLGYFG